MQRTQKPFPHIISTQFSLDKTNWSLRETIQTLKILSKKPIKNAKYVWHGSCCSTNNSRIHSPLSYGGGIQFKEKQKETIKEKPKSQPLCNN
ncbi:hypothetical protein M0812_17762 [Anaeramoeba flamelloides]|uniref:Uncharacterized protein n=1 Tax=Anaeramoeba flamelloides TaxID=1746091 RepID=A0AAV7Z3Z4_9EUKA|nr:hypothetical protein M0812_17762 [Anaeramoeba flamelloides]